MAVSIAGIMMSLPSVFAPEKAEGVEAVVHFKFTGAEAGEWNATIRDGQCQVAQGIPRSRPTLSLAADSSDFVRVVAGELDGMQAFMDGTLKVTGDMLVARKLVKLFRMP
ncbi:MAG: SCP2 sterol-binding domain-containing protein [Chloroflexota bacterium]